MNCASGRTKGTCVPECPSYGSCHCGCGAVQPRADKRNTKLQRWKGEPSMWAPAHSPTWAAARFGPGDTRAYRGPAPKHLTDVDVEIVIPLVDMLVARYGSSAAAARVVGVMGTNLRRIRRRHYTKVSAEVAGKITAAVLAIQRGQEPAAGQDLPRVGYNATRDPSLAWHVPTAPLAAFLELEDYDLNSFGPNTSRQLHRWFSEGQAPVYGADEFCTSELYLHPIRIWGPGWPDSPFYEKEAASA